MTPSASVHELGKRVFFTLPPWMRIIFHAQIAGRAAQRLGQPSVINETIGGLLPVACGSKS
jgi:Kef-type K+ transport system membrane component KefB